MAGGRRGGGMTGARAEELSSRLRSQHLNIGRAGLPGPVEPHHGPLHGAHEALRRILAVQHRPLAPDHVPVHAVPGRHQSREGSRLGWNSWPARGSDSSATRFSCTRCSASGSATTVPPACRCVRTGSLRLPVRAQPRFSGTATGLGAARFRCGLTAARGSRRAREPVAWARFSWVRCAFHGLALRKSVIRVRQMTSTHEERTEPMKSGWRVTGEHGGVARRDSAGPESATARRARPVRRAPEAAGGGRVTVRDIDGIKSTGG
jgi:hypothetical protein